MSRTRLAVTIPLLPSVNSNDVRRVDEEYMMGGFEAETAVVDAETTPASHARPAAPWARRLAWPVLFAGAGLALFDELMRRVPMRLGVTFASIDQTIQNAALIVAPIAGGTLSVAIGIRNALVVASIVSVAGFGLFALDLYRTRRG